MDEPDDSRKRKFAKLELLMVASLFLLPLSLINDITNKQSFFSYFPKGHSLYLFIFTTTFPLFAFMFASFKLMVGYCLLINFYLIMMIIKLIDLEYSQWQLSCLYSPSLAAVLSVISGLLAKNYKKHRVLAKSSNT